MKIARYADANGKTAYGIVRGGAIVACEGTPFEGLRETASSLPLASVRLLAPIDPYEVLCVGRNYMDHAKEGGADAPPAPLLFIKARSSVCAPSDEVRISDSISTQVDFEAELAVVIGKDAKNISEQDAPSHIFGYVCANDVSARDCQFADGQWARGKSFDSFCPLGPWIETQLDVSDLKIEGRLNGAVMQSARTSQLIFKIPYIISYFSRSMTLRQGTVILTGTPAGCGFARKPPVWLKPGDVYEVDVEGLGVLRSEFA